ncbi:MAG: trypsin-like peptidase domain-containing protein [Patescibacteria group bacterium]|nr:trypsin-like peptidase domain-containing protein [Patescibacteria group bacterium]
MVFVCVCLSAFPARGAVRAEASADAPDLIGAEMRALEAESSYVVKIIAGSKDNLSLGTGFVFKDSGAWHLVTNNHVVEQASLTAWVQFHGTGGYQRVRIIGRDPAQDTALLEAPTPIPDGIVPAVLGKSRELRVGDRVYAIGHPYGKRNVSIGWVNGLTSPISSHFVSTQAPMHPGNSGGPLVRFRDGTPEIVGLNTAIATTGLLSMSLGIDHLRKMLPRLKTERVVHHASSGLLVRDIDDVPPPLFEAATDTPYAERSTLCSGVFIYEVQAHSSAEKVGVRAGDCVRSIILVGREVSFRSAEQFADMIFFDFRPEERVTIKTTRGSQEFLREITLGTHTKTPGSK